LKNRVVVGAKPARATIFILFIWISCRTGPMQRHPAQTRNVPGASPGCGTLSNPSVAQAEERPPDKRKIQVQVLSEGPSFHAPLANQRSCLSSKQEWPGRHRHGAPFFSVPVAQHPERCFPEAEVVGENPTGNTPLSTPSWPIQKGAFLVRRIMPVRNRPGDPFRWCL
jgi:hypothetical protein